MTQTSFIIILILLIAGFGAIIGVFIWYYRRTQSQQRERQESMRDPLFLMNQNIQGMQQAVQDRLLDVHKELARVTETTRQVINFADQLQDLQDILKNPKQRGILGEYYLETVLKNVLPPRAYQLQYAFRNGDTVDAAIFVGKKIIPVDSKFSLENYNRIVQERDPAQREQLERLFKQDLKNRIDETSKYIRPEEETMDFAFMFIPAEAIYYDLLINQVGAVKVNTRDLIEYAFRDKRVIIVSPTSFFAYLQTVLQGLRALKIEESAKEIQANVEQLAKHLTAYYDHLRRLGNQLSTTVNTYNTASNEYRKIDKDIYRITGQSHQSETIALEKPEQDK